MRRKTWACLVSAALAALLWCGCAGVIAEKVNDNGQTEKISVGTIDKWSTWDKNATKKDESLIMLKKESTF